MGNRSCGLLVFGVACLVVSACSGTDASGLTAAVQGTAGGAAGASGSPQGGAAGTSGGGGSAATSGGAGVAGAGGLVANGGSAGTAGVAGAGGSAGSSAAGGASGSGGKGGAAGSGGAGASGGTAGSGGAGAGGGSGGAGASGGDIDAGQDTGSGGTGGQDAAPDVVATPVAYGTSANKIGCAQGPNTFEHVLDWGAGNGRVVVLGALIRGNGEQFSSVLYASAPMHELGSRAVAGMNPWTVWLFYLLDSELPNAAGTNTVTAGFAGQVTSCQIDVSSFAHAAQSAPPFTSTQATTAGWFTAGLANSTAGSMGYDFIGSAQGNLTAGNGQTVVTTNDGFTYHSRASYKTCGDANPCNMSWNPQNIVAYAWMMALLQAQ